MIVRIMTDNQYRMADSHTAAIDKMDEELMAALQAGDEPRFDAVLARMIDLVRQNGQVVPYEEVVPSDIILPIPDMTLEECREVMEKTAAHQVQSGGA
jgi:predicted transcriptional regulator